MNDHSIKIAPVSHKFAVDGDLGIIEGLASPFNDEPDSQGDIIAPGAFTKSLKTRSVVMLWAHDQARPVGRWTELKETEKGLLVRGQLNLKTSLGREAFEHIKAGDINGLSIGYVVPSNGWKRHKAGRILSEIELHEISLVSVPSASRARITGVKQFSTPAELKDALREIGCSRAAAEKITRGGWPALSGKDNHKLFDSIRALRKAAQDMR